MSEISAWRDATSDTDETVTGPELDAASAGSTSAAADSIEAELDAALASTEQEEVDTFDTAPTEPVLLLADHSGESAADEAVDGFDHDELEHGIASVIASLYADARDGSATEAFGEADEAADESDPVDDAVTYRLLGELDRLWHRAA